MKDSLEQLLEVVKNKLKTEGEVVRRCSNRYCDKAITKRLDGKLKLVRDAYGTGKDNEEKLLFCEECYKERKVE